MGTRRRGGRLVKPVLYFQSYQAVEIPAVAGDESESSSQCHPGQPDVLSVVTFNLPDNLHQKAREVAASKNLSMDALVAMALTQSLSRLVRDPHLEARAARATGKGIGEFLAQVPSAEPPEWDRLPEGYQREK